MTSLIELLELSNFGHLTTSTIEFESSDKIFLVALWSTILTSLHLFLSIFISGRPGVADIIIVLTMSI